VNAGRRHNAVLRGTILMLPANSAAPTSDAHRQRCKWYEADVTYLRTAPLPVVVSALLVRDGSESTGKYAMASKWAVLSVLAYATGNTMPRHRTTYVV